MSKFKKVTRVLILAFLILLACSGVAMLPFNRHKFMDNEIRIELVDEKDDEEDERELKDIKQ